MLTCQLYDQPAPHLQRDGRILREQPRVAAVSLLCRREANHLSRDERRAVVRDAAVEQWLQEQREVCRGGPTTATRDTCDSNRQSVSIRVSNSCFMMIDCLLRTACLGKHRRFSV